MRVIDLRVKCADVGVDHLCRGEEGLGKTSTFKAWAEEVPTWKARNRPSEKQEGLSAFTE